MGINPQDVATAPFRAFDGEAFRQQSPNYDPRDGQGALINGGRFNPRESFPVLYLCTTRGCAVAEFLRRAERNRLPPGTFLPRALFRYEINLTRVLDLTASETLSAVGLSRGQVVSASWSRTQELGELAHALEFQAILAPSATDVDAVLAVFTQNVANDVVTPTLVERWERLEDL